jgi:1,4-alpha-glucan branching enzyme
MYTQPGKKLLFMGTELAPEIEWRHDSPLPWELAEQPMRAAFGRYLEDLGALYSATRALWASDPEPETFAWIDASDVESSVYSYIRRAGDDVAVIVQNLTPVPRPDYRLGVPHAGRWMEALNSDSEHYGGSNVGNLGALQASDRTWHGQPASVQLVLPPLGSLVLVPEEQARR